MLCVFSPPVEREYTKRNSRGDERFALHNRNSIKKSESREKQFLRIYAITKRTDLLEILI